MDLLKEPNSKDSILKLWHFLHNSIYDQRDFTKLDTFVQKLKDKRTRMQNNVKKRLLKMEKVDVEFVDRINLEVGLMENLVFVDLGSEEN